MRFFLPGILAMLLFSGCVLVENPYIATRDYDPIPEKSYNLKKIQLDINQVRNLSGSDRRFYIRKKTGEANVDEFNRWTMAPGFLLERVLRMRIINDESGKSLKLDAVLLRFEIDKSADETVLAVEYTVYDYEHRKTFDRIYRSKIQGEEAADVCMSMQQTLEQAVLGLGDDLQKFAQTSQEAK